MSIKGDILHEAAELVDGDRTEAYGSPLHNYERITETFNALTRHELTPKEGVIFMCCVKLAREMHCHKKDNLIDLAGYAACLGEMLQQETARCPLCKEEREGTTKNPGFYYCEKCSFTFTATPEKESNFPFLKGTSRETGLCPYCDKKGKYVEEPNIYECKSCLAMSNFCDSVRFFGPAVPEAERIRYED